MLEINKLAGLRFREAQGKYNRAFDPALYNAAVRGKSIAYANYLIDEALALVGSPHHRVSRRRWAAPALAFLARFAEIDLG